jgi:hypothetical protein
LQGHRFLPGQVLTPAQLALSELDETSLSAES